MFEHQRARSPRRDRVLPARHGETRGSGLRLPAPRKKSVSKKIRAPTMLCAKTQGRHMTKREELARGLIEQGKERLGKFFGNSPRNACPISGWREYLSKWRHSQKNARSRNVGTQLANQHTPSATPGIGYGVKAHESSGYARTVTITKKRGQGFVILTQK